MLQFYVLYSINLSFFFSHIIFPLDKYRGKINRKFTVLIFQSARKLPLTWLKTFICVPNIILIH